MTGTLGDAAAGFLDGHPLGLGWLRRPQPPVSFGAALGLHGLAHAMMDLSDGLSRDLARLCQASGVGALVDPALLPAGPPLADLPASARLARQVAFGDDYQLLFAAAPGDAPAIQALAAAHDLLVTRVGQLVADGGPRLLGQPWPAALFDHFPPGVSPS